MIWYIMNCYIHRETVYVWMLLFGSSEEARNYSCKISITNKFGIEFIYSGPVHSLEKSEKAIINSGFLLTIRPNAAKNLVDEENRLEIDVSVRNLKKEAIFKESPVFYQKESDFLEDIYVDTDRYRRYSESD